MLIYLDYNNELDSYVIDDAEINKLNSEGIVCNIKIKGFADNPNKPLIGVLMGREENAYSIHNEYIKSVTDAGGNIKLLDYTNCVSQIQDCDGVLLIGGSFSVPKQYCAHVSEGNLTYNHRFNAYVSSYMAAMAMKIPVLGVCAGAQIIGALNNYKMDFVPSKDIHQTKDINAHKIQIKKDTLLYKILNKEEVTVNSRHQEMIINTNASSDLSVYAVSPEDNVLEAWGDEKTKTLCVQWHPETMYVKDNNQDQLKIYQWLVDLAKEY